MHCKSKLQKKKKKIKQTILYIELTLFQLPCSGSGHAGLYCGLQWCSESAMVPFFLLDGTIPSGPAHDGQVGGCHILK